ncbi:MULTISPECIES: tautomerase family protein [Buttiauxella]|jgi:phenylpyruvate tautomerase PptA (4-oxalocrotonate tautomerase family)|nr:MULTISPECIES: tautomerase family protein [Buttiauxella]AYN26038.1 tautomerase family protein [Buttiauxella sp. 3AFRM03]MCE0824689.1 tautomerase family protein [Buttiauxella ferragutiae]TDN54277.1 tautomerase-like protein [Buttiauxella sp. JUb87]
MPLIKFDIVEGRSEKEIKIMLDAAHRAMLKAFDVPERDRYQVVNEHKASHLIAEDTGLGIVRTRNIVIVSVVSRPRTEQSKKTFYHELCRELQEHCGIAPSDVMVSITINSDADWSFGHGVAQFLTGEL